jgi:molybdopterin-guanine dinucleotide biosynthesis protein A
VAVSALRAAGTDPVVLIGGSPEASAILSIPSIPDRLPGQGPLGGLWTALTWASGVERVVVVPCDMPGITDLVVRALIRGGDNSTAAVGSIGGEPHPILGCWPTQWAAGIHDLLRSGQRRMTAVLDLGSYELVEVDRSQVADADDPAELDRLVESAGGLE